MNAVAITMPDGRTWTPRFVQAINQQACIGCGRCFKVCGRDVDFDDDDEYEKKVMTIANQMNCIGCEACSRICPKKCYSHAPMTEDE
jgi:Nif-specific ferredoxin III